MTCQIARLSKESVRGSSGLGCVNEGPASCAQHELVQALALACKKRIAKMLVHNLQGGSFSSKGAEGAPREGEGEGR